MTKKLIGGPSRVTIEIPACPNCLADLHLVRIAPGPAGFDLRTFECPLCQQVVTMPAVVEVAPDTQS